MRFPSLFPSFDLFFHSLQLPFDCFHSLAIIFFFDLVGIKNWKDIESRFVYVRLEEWRQTETVYFRQPEKLGIYLYPLLIKLFVYLSIDMAYLYPQHYLSAQPRHEVVGESREHHRGADSPDDVKEFCKLYFLPSPPFRFT